MALALHHPWGWLRPSFCLPMDPGARHGSTESVSSSLKESQQVLPCLLPWGQITITDFYVFYELQSAVGISFLSILWFLFYFLNYKFLKAKTMPQLLWSCAMKSNSEDSGDTIPSVNSLPRLVFWLVATMMGLLGLLQDFYLQWAAIYWEWSQRYQFH